MAYLRYLVNRLSLLAPHSMASPPPLRDRDDAARRTNRNPRTHEPILILERQPSRLRPAPRAPNAWTFGIRRQSTDTVTARGPSLVGNRNQLPRYACACACRPLASSAEILSVGMGVSTHSSTATGVSLGACARLQDVHRLPLGRRKGLYTVPGPPPPPPRPAAGPGSRPRTPRRRSDSCYVLTNHPPSAAIRHSRTGDAHFDSRSTSSMSWRHTAARAVCMLSRSYQSFLPSSG